MTMPFRPILFLFAATPLLAPAPVSAQKLPTASPAKAAPPPSPLPSVETLLTWLQTADPVARAKAQAKLPETLSWPGETSIEKRDRQWGRQLYGKTPNAVRDYEWLHRRVLILLAYQGAKAQKAVPTLLDWREDGPAEGAPAFNAQTFPSLPSPVSAAPTVTTAPSLPAFPSDSGAPRDTTPMPLPPPPHRSGAALYALTFIAPDDPRVIDVLLAEWIKPNEDAGRAINRLGARDSILQGLRRRPIEYLGINAVSLLAKFGPKAHDFVPKIAHYLGDENDASARVAMTTLMRIGGTAAEIENALTSRLNDKDPSLQNDAFYGLVRLARSKPRLAATDALKTLDNWKTATSINLARAMVVLASSPLDETTVPVYSRVVRQNPPDYLESQLWPIIERNRPGRFASLIQLMIERHPESLASLQPDEAALRPLQAALSHPKWEVRIAGLTGLAKLGTVSQPLRPAMEQVLMSSVNDAKAKPVRPQLLETAQLLQMQAAIRPALMVWLDDSLKTLQTSSAPREEDYRYYAQLINAICESGLSRRANRNSEFGALEKHAQQALSMDNVPVFIAATRLARLVQPPVSTILPRLQEVLSANFEGLTEPQGATGRKRSVEARLAALRLVQTLGPSAKVLAPRLREIMETRDALWIHCYEAAQNALATISVEDKETPTPPAASPAPPVAPPTNLPTAPSVTTKTSYQITPSLNSLRPQNPMKFADSSRGKNFSKDPSVISFRGQYWMYYSLPPWGDGRPDDGWCIGIAQSSDLENWKPVGQILPAQEPEKKGLCAPGALVLNNKVHLFYQTYGNGPRDAICHAVSDDGLTFTRNPSNPIFRPTGEWNNGRAIDAEAFPHKDELFLYWATRDPSGQIQQVGVSSAPLNSDFARDKWTQRCDAPILKPELTWEQKCIEAPTIIYKENRFWMFYAGAYNNAPQQIGVAVSDDGVRWQRVSTEPFLPNGKPDEWNSSESGHPGVFQTPDGRVWLFFQGNNDKGKTWYLSKVEVVWKNGVPVLAA